MNAAGTLPKRHNTVLAEVLASLLAGATLTHGDALSACSTMRLAITSTRSKKTTTGTL